MKQERAYKELKGMKIFVVYESGQIGAYRSEESAATEINLNDGAADSVRKVIVGYELKMLTGKCRQLRCFEPAGKRRRVKHGVQ